MRFAEVAAASRDVAARSGRLAKVERLADCLRRLAPDEIVPAVGFLTGEPRQGRVGIGGAALRQAIPESAAASPSLTVAEVDEALARLGATRGAGSAQARIGLLRELLQRATAEEQDFLVRLLLGELRQGALHGLMIEAVARAAEIPVAQVRRAVTQAGALGTVAVAALTEGQAGLARFAIELFRPLRPMLAQSADDVAEALAHLGDAAFEYKLDGARIQVHKGGGEVRVYTRNLREVTPAVPEVVEALATIAVPEIILDGEVVAFHASGVPQPFQVTMRRFGRKQSIDHLREALPLSAFFFDCLYLAGAGLLDLPAVERFATLARVVPAPLVIPRRVTAEAAVAQTFLNEALGAGHEGVMAKALSAPYEAGARGRGWLKIKPALTLDLVILAAEWGHGRRRGWLSNLHLGARAPGAERFVMLGKTFKGLTDEMLAWQTQRLLELERGRDGHTVYVRPELVVEVTFNEIQESPHYPGGMALRFARVKRYRPDKDAAEADTIETVREIFERRAR